MGISPSGGTSRGFTLIELMMALVTASILFVALGSAIVLATHALPDTNSSASVTLEAAPVISDLTSELRYALDFTKRFANEVEFTVADRTGDTVPETIRYLWEGNPGDPLKRKYNNGSNYKVLESVENFALEYEVKTGPPDALTAVRVSLQATSDPTTQIHTAAMIANQVDVTP